MRKITLLLVLTSTNVFGYQYYTCPKNTDAYLKCSEECKKSEYEVDFRINVNNSNVLQIITNRKTGEQKIGALEGCKVFDEKTFVCKTESRFSITQHNLFEGVYTKKNDWINPIKPFDESLNIRGCGK